MRAFLEILLSLLSAFGLVSLGWLLFGYALSGTRSCALVPGRGDGEDLEQAVRGLLWLRLSGLTPGRVVIVDCGLTEEGRALADALCRREPEVELCPKTELEAYIEAL